MSGSKLLEGKREDSTLSIVVVAEELTAYLFKITSNEKQFPRAFRYTLISQIRNTCLKIDKKLYVACAKKPMNEKDFKRILKTQDKIYDTLLELKGLITVSIDIANLNNPNHLAKLFDDTVAAFNRWVKNTKRIYAKYRWKMSTPPDERASLHVDSVARKLCPTMPHDDNGFIVLKKKKKQ